MFKKSHTSPPRPLTEPLARDFSCLFSPVIVDPAKLISNYSSQVLGNASFIDRSL